MGDVQDDASIGDEDELWRRVPRHHWIGCPGAHCRPSSQTFEDDADGALSVDIARLTTVAKILAGHEGYAVLSFTAGLARSCGLVVAGDRTPLNRAHAIVIGNKTGSRRRTLVRGSHWIVEPG